VLYTEDMLTLDPTRLVFVDETGILTNMTRRYARAAVGARACGSAPAAWKRLTVLGAMSCEGVVGAMTTSSGPATDVFVEFLTTTVLPFLTEHKPDAILVCDNLSAPKNKAVPKVIEEAGLVLRYLPRYSPAFSPIEACWSKLKTALRAAEARTVETLKAELARALAEVTAQDAGAGFRHCGYKMVS
jgi:transposase